MREKILSNRVEDVALSKDIKVCDLINQFKNIGGFMAPRLYRAVEIIKEMSSRECTNFLSFTGNIVATGVRGILAQLIKRRVFHVIITTCGAIDHDIARSLGGKYACGEFEMDDVFLNNMEIHRLGNVLIPLEDYGPLIEKFTKDVLPEILKGRDEISPSELIKEIGSKIKDENSIIKAAYDANVPIFVPGIVDGSFGTNLYFYAKTNRLSLNLFKDMDFLINMVFDAKESGALIIGGGISKHHVIWWNQFRGGLDYCVYLTTALEYDGSLSGAMPREAISWGKLKPTAKYISVIGDATITLPLIASAIL
ncbi:MAG: deoxyhypusine synthase [Candidatus Methanomethyliaceae archaeon]|nr:deoxyhypusine synthase [Candidatus Methanomethyliaceae archaeon]